jgi:uncharacterized protein (TIGR02145 family)
MQSKQKNILIFSALCFILAIAVFCWLLLKKSPPATASEPDSHTAAEIAASEADDDEEEEAKAQKKPEKKSKALEEAAAPDEMLETIAIGTQTWLKYDLNVVPKNGKSWCYNEEPANCALYGRLYNWAAAKTVCPKGFHLPTNADWNKLMSFAGGESSTSKLKATSGWNENGNGTDNYGFSAVPSGYRNSNGSFTHLGVYGRWWSANDKENSASVYEMSYKNDGIGKGKFNKECGFLVRCVKN